MSCIVLYTTQYCSILIYTYQYISIHTYAYPYIPIHTNTYRYTPIHTNTKNAIIAIIRNRTYDSAYTRAIPNALPNWPPISEIRCLVLYFIFGLHFSHQFWVEHILNACCALNESQFCNFNPTTTSSFTSRNNTYHNICQYGPIHAVMFRYIPIQPITTNTYQNMYWNTYQYVLIHTDTYQYILVHWPTWPLISAPHAQRGSQSFLYAFEAVGYTAAECVLPTAAGLRAAAPDVRTP